MKQKKVISVNGISKTFHKKNGTTFNALENITFDLKKGEVVGLIGKNGSGKSTLLKILSGILKPSNGQIIIEGHISSILDIGTGFHPDLTGRENIFLSGNLLGIKKYEIENVFNDLLAFSELEEFIDESVKNYSSGMYMRLAFSIFAFLKPEILILDEVFSVGDVAFQKKCLQKMRQLIKTGTTILMVSHDMNEIITICNRIILLDEGKILKDGDASSISNFYLENILLNNHFQAKVLTKNFIEFKERLDNGIILLKSIEVKGVGKNHNDKIYANDEVELNFEYEKYNEGTVQIVLFVHSTSNESIFSDSYALRKDFEPINSSLGNYIENVIIPKHYFNKGLFFVSLAIAKNYDVEEDLIELNQILSFRVHLEKWDENNVWSQIISSPLRPQLIWNISKK